MAGRVHPVDAQVGRMGSQKPQRHPLPHLVFRPRAVQLRLQTDRRRVGSGSRTLRRRAARFRAMPAPPSTRKPCPARPASASQRPRLIRKAGRQGRASHPARPVRLPSGREFGLSHQPGPIPLLEPLPPRLTGRPGRETASRVSARRLARAGWQAACREQAGPTAGGVSFGSTMPRRRSRRARRAARGSIIARSTSGSKAGSAPPFHWGPRTGASGPMIPGASLRTDGGGGKVGAGGPIGGAAAGDSLWTGGCPGPAMAPEGAPRRRLGRPPPAVAPHAPPRQPGPAGAGARRTAESRPPPLPRPGGADRFSSTATPSVAASFDFQG